MNNTYQITFKEQGTSLKLEIEAETKREALSEFHDMTLSDMIISDVEVKNMSIPKGWDQEEQHLNQRYFKGRYSILENEEGFSAFRAKMIGDPEPLGKKPNLQDALSLVAKSQEKKSNLKQ